MEKSQGRFDNESRGNYSKILTETYNKELQGAFPDRIHFGPNYHAITSNGMPIQITSLLVDPVSGRFDDTNEGQLKVHRSVIVLAFDDQGYIAGHKAMRLLSDRPGFLHARGDTATAIQGDKVAKWLELATVDILKMVAARRNSVIKWEVENGNLHGLYKAQKTGDPALIEQKKKEQAAWQALYGPEGKLGFHYDSKEINFQNKGYLMITPEAQNVEDLELIDNANLGAREITIDGRNIIVPRVSEVIKVPESQKDALRNQNLKDFAERIYPKIAAITQNDQLMSPAA